MYVDLSSVQPQIASIISGAKEKGDRRQTAAAAGWTARVRHDDGTCEEGGEKIEEAINLTSLKKKCCLQCLQPKIKFPRSVR